MWSAFWPKSSNVPCGQDVHAGGVSGVVAEETVGDMNGGGADATDRAGSSAHGVDADDSSVGAGTGAERKTQHGSKVEHVISLLPVPLGARGVYDDASIGAPEVGEAGNNKGLDSSSGDVSKDVSKDGGGGLFSGGFFGSSGGLLS